VIFDHDGTLVDSLRLVVEATNRVLADHGHAVVPAPVIIAAMIHPTAERMGLHAAQSDHAVRAQLASAFVRAARLTSTDIAPPYPGVPALVRALQARGLSLGVVSNNDGQTIRRIMQAHDLAGAFACLFGEEDMPAPKPDPRGILLAAAAMRLDAGSCVYVGDSGGDAVAAHAAGMRAVGVTWGIHTRQQMAEMGFDLLVDHPDGILDLVG
jgi:phosphoglycolate phosphatase